MPSVQRAKGAGGAKPVEPADGANEAHGRDGVGGLHTRGGGTRGVTSLDMSTLEIHVEPSGVPSAGSSRSSSRSRGVMLPPSTGTSGQFLRRVDSGPVTFHVEDADHAGAWSSANSRAASPSPASPSHFDYHPQLHTALHPHSHHHAHQHTLQISQYFAALHHSSHHHSHLRDTVPENCDIASIDHGDGDGDGDDEREDDGNGDDEDDAEYEGEDEDDAVVMRSKGRP